jgi:homotetrameric cytidine deaminase
MNASRRRAPSLIESFNFAFEGVIHVLRTQRNMRIHFAVAAAVLIAAVAVGVERIELMALLIAISFVLIAEMINSALEAGIDVATTSFDPLAKLAKDIAAGAVLIATVNAVAVGYLVFSEKVVNHSSRLVVRLRDAPSELTLIALVLTIILVLATKAYTGRGTPLRRRLTPLVPDHLLDLPDGPARGADPGRVGRALVSRGDLRRRARRARGPCHVPGVRMSADLYERAVAIAERAYAPYSNFFVGAAVRARDGRIFEGVNVENAAYPLGICAERTAIGYAVVEGCGPGDLEEIAITAAPCGGCRQWLYEFRLERVTFKNAAGEVVTRTPTELLPETFEL